MIPRSRTTIRYLTQEQTARLFSVIADLRDRALFATIYHYGLRVSEVALLQLKDVDIDQGRIFIHRVKNGMGGERPLFSNTTQVLKAYLEMRLNTDSTLFTGRQGGMSRQRIQQLFREYAGKAGLEEQFTVHSLRHSIATHLLEAGQGIEFVRDHLGHVNIQNTLIYAKLTDRRREKIFKQLENSPDIVRL